MPRPVTLHFGTNPSGLSLVFCGDEMPIPVTIVSWENLKLTVKARNQYFYHVELWSGLNDGESTLTRDFVTPESTLEPYVTTFLDTRISAIPSSNPTRVPTTASTASTNTQVSPNDAQNDASSQTNDDVTYVAYDGADEDAGALQLTPVDLGDMLTPDILLSDGDEPQIHADTGMPIQTKSSASSKASVFGLFVGPFVMIAVL